MYELVLFFISPPLLEPVMVGNDLALLCTLYSNHGKKMRLGPARRNVDILILYFDMGIGISTFSILLMGTEKRERENERERTERYWHVVVP